MKNLTFFLAFLFIATTGIAQKYSERNGVDDIDRENFFRIGGKVGFNVNKIPGTAYSEGFNYNYQIGGFMQFNFSKRFGIQPEANFVQVTSQSGKEASDITDDLFRDGVQKNAKFDYLQIPILLNINLGESRHVKLQVGPSYGIYLKGAAQTKEADIVQYKNNELGAVGGLWIQLPFFNIGGRYQLGFDKQYDVVTKKSALNQAIQVFMGFTF